MNGRGSNVGLEDSSFAKWLTSSTHTRPQSNLFFSLPPIVAKSWEALSQHFAKFGKVKKVLVTKAGAKN